MNESCTTDNDNLEYYLPVEIATEFQSNKNCKEVVIVLADTSYIFRMDEIESISSDENEAILKGNTVFSSSNYNISGQSCISFNDTIIAFDTGGRATAISMLTKEQTSFIPESTTYNPHCNVANHYYYNGKHYVYLSEWDGKHRCFVEELSRDSELDRWTSRLVQIISLDIDDTIRGNGNMDWIVDQDNEKLYVQTYKDGTSENATGLVYLELPLVNPTDSECITMTADMVLRRIEHPMIYITQDKKIYKNKLFVASGWGGSFPGKVTVIDLDSFKDCFEFNLGELNDEPEGLCLYKDNLMITYWGHNFFVQNKESIFIHFKNSICLSYPIESIHKIYFN